MQLIDSTLSARRAKAFTLAEVVVSSGIVALLVLANMAAVYNVRILDAKDSERGVISGFMQHYAELVKALPFDQVLPNEPLSGLYNGANGTPSVTLPSSDAWISLTDTNFQTFHPALIWVTNRNPRMSVSIETATVSGIAHDKHICIQVQWDAPLSVGNRLSQRLDLLRVKDL